jgi:hypothetical protein
LNDRNAARTRLSDAEWRKSRRSQTNGCVEVTTLGDMVAVRDSKDPDGPVLHFSQHEWASFLAGVIDGDFAFSLVHDSLPDSTAQPILPIDPGRWS